MGGRKKARIIKFLKTAYAIGDKAPASAIYECSECENITAFKKGETFLPCEEDHGDEEQEWYRTNQFVHFVSKNLNVEFKKMETFSLKLADFIAEFSGTMVFIYFHVLWFLFWIYTNTGHKIFGLINFDPYPFGLLTMMVSLEAIFLSTFILISQNRQAAKSELRAELDYQTNLKTEKDVAEILSMLHELRQEGRLLVKDADEVIEEIEEKHRHKPRHYHVKRHAELLRHHGIDHAELIHE
jgi:uncharacterized membrane protein